MTQIEDLQTRLARALDRISASLDQPSGIDAGALAAAQTEAQAASAEAARQTEAADALRAEMAGLREQLAATQEELSAVQGQLEPLQEQLTSTQTALEEAQAAATPDPDAPTSADMMAMRSELEDERIANAQLEERIRTLRDRIEEAPAPAPAAPSADVAQLDNDIKALRAALEDLADASGRLREANAQGVGEAHLINQSMKAELETLRAARAVETSEARAVLDLLEPLLAGAAQSQPQTEGQGG